MEVLHDVYLKLHQKMEDCIVISEEFEKLWNLPHHIWAIVGKHVAIKSPKLSEMQYFSYKEYFSAVLLAICDAKYCFIYIDFRQYVITNDSNVLRSSGLYKDFEGKNLHISPRAKTKDFENPLLYYLLDLEIFLLGPWLMRPYLGFLDDSQENIQLPTFKGKVYNRKCF